MKTVIVWRLHRDGEVHVYSNLTEDEADRKVEDAVALLELAGIKDPLLFIAVVDG